MLVREVNRSEKEAFNKIATHPLQSWEWGEFREKTGVKVVRLGAFSATGGHGGSKLVAGYQVTIHELPGMGVTVGYFPKGTMPDEWQLEALKKVGQENNSLMVKLEPNISVPVETESVKASGHKSIREFLLERGCKEGRPLFTKYTFEVDLTKSEEELKAAMKPKTRYNIGVAQRHGVVVTEDNSKEAFNEYLRLVEETTKRQGFYAHDEKYRRLMWEILQPAGLARLLVARWRGKVLAAWIVFVFGGVIYYPYGASSSKHREMMASNLMMWEVMRLGKRLGCKTLDMWGSLGPKANKADPWYGFHRFKEGYGGQLVEFLGSFDLVLKPGWYKLYRLAEEWRWKWLRLKAKLG